MKLHVGQAALQGGIRRYPFDMLELPVEQSLPQPKKLATWPDARPDRVFSLRLPLSSVLPSAEQQQLVALAREAREALGARWCVLSTGPATTPTPRNRAQLERLGQELRHEAWRLAWEPRGVWGPEEAERWAEELGFVLVRDLSREAPPPGAVIYTRLRGLGFGARVGARAVERLAMNLDEAEEAYVILEGDGAQRAATLLRELLADRLEEQS
jgi:hypothetical protein